MQDFNHYKLEDFLADSDFCHWVLSPDRQRSYSTWSILKEQNPAAGLVMDQAAQLIRYAQTSAAELPESQVNQQITRILKDARTLETVMPLPLVKPLISWKKLLIAASVFVSVALGWMLYLQNRAFPNQSVYHAYVDDKKETLLEAVNQAQDLKTFELPDKSKITLYPKSRLSYKKAFGENGNREVYLEGKAFFLVRKDETHPFLVFANGLLTRVVGTSFHVETTTEGANVKVRTGKVAVMPVEGKNKKELLLLTPNQQVYFSSKENTVQKSIVEQPLAIENKVTKTDFEFVNQPMPEVFEKLRRIYGIDIIYDEAVLKDCYVDVTLSNEPFFTKLDILCKTIGATYQNADGRITVISQGCH
jgi:transmembrane sensor